jgi:hypothetical protein
LTEIKEELSKRNKWYPGWLIERMIAKYVDIIEGPIDRVITKIENAVRAAPVEEMQPPAETPYAYGGGTAGLQPGEEPYVPPSVMAESKSTVMEKTESGIQLPEGESQPQPKEDRLFMTERNGQPTPAYEMRTPAGKTFIYPGDVYKMSEGEVNRVYYDMFPNSEDQSLAAKRIAVDFAFRAKASGEEK